ncbi:hypothetical protein, partial [Bacillus wiedmannii]|uniref:hypothetical protein n=1 Tax=Bacillus wiedmannii TaxID=1890302 RepID=UPI000BFCDD62
EKYGEDFYFSREGKLDIEPYYIYNYVLNREVFIRMQEYLIKRDRPSWVSNDPETKGFGDSFQEIHIRDDGKVEVIGPSN